MNSHLIQSIHIKWCGIETISSLSINVLWSAATSWNARSCTVIGLEPVTWSLNSAAHQFPLKCVPSHHVILINKVAKELNNNDVNNHAIILLRVHSLDFDDSLIFAIECWVCHANRSWSKRQQFQQQFQQWK